MAFLKLSKSEMISLRQMQFVCGVFKAPQADQNCQHVLKYRERTNEEMEEMNLWNY